MIENMDLSFFLEVIKKQWMRIVFIAAILAICAGVISKVFIERVYFSSVTLYFGKINEDKASEDRSADSNIRKTSAELSLGSQVIGDYIKLVDLNVVDSKVKDELKVKKLWKPLNYNVKTMLLDDSRMMKITITSSDPFYCLDVINIYVKEFIIKAEQLVNVKNIEIIEESNLQLRPISPNIPQNIILTFVGGLLLTFALACIRRFFNSTFLSSEQFEKVFNMPVIGTVRRERSVAEARPLLWDRDSKSLYGRIVDDFRVFRVNLINSGENKINDDQGVVFAVTSTFPKEGKTFCTTNLGAALAEAGYKVLLIDCDTEKQGLQRYFGKPEDKGLINVLSNENSFDDVVQRNLHNSNMDVLFCGDKDVVSSNLIISPDFKHLVKNLKSKYDFAFLDVSTNQGVADIVSAGTTADSVLLLVQAGKTEKDMIQNTLDVLKRANLDISGVILNGIKEE